MSDKMAREAVLREFGLVNTHYAWQLAGSYGLTTCACCGTEWPCAVSRLADALVAARRENSELRRQIVAGVFDAAAAGITLINTDLLATLRADLARAEEQLGEVDTLKLAVETLHDEQKAVEAVCFRICWENTPETGEQDLSRPRFILTNEDADPIIETGSVIGVIELMRACWVDTSERLENAQRELLSSQSQLARRDAELKEMNERRSLCGHFRDSAGLGQHCCSPLGHPGEHDYRPIARAAGSLDAEIVDLRSQLARAQEALGTTGVALLVDTDADTGHSWVVAVGQTASHDDVVWCQWCGRHRVEVADWIENPECSAFVAIRAALAAGFTPTPNTGAPDE